MHSINLVNGQLMKSAMQFGVASSAEALSVLRKGSKHRQKAGTALNHQSSRSHSIFTVSLCSCKPRICTASAIAF